MNPKPLVVLNHFTVPVGISRVSFYLALHPAFCRAIFGARGRLEPVNLRPPDDCTQAQDRMVLRKIKKKATCIVA